MRYEMRCTAYDVVGEVWISITLHQSEIGAEHGTPPVMQWTATALGVGELDPEKWVRDALRSAEEAVTRKKDHR